MAKTDKKENQRRHNRKLKNRLCKNIRHGIYKGFRTGKGGRWESRVDYTLAELRGHLQKQFTDGMSWANYGMNDGQWHIDHIKPVSFFDFSSYGDKDFECYWSLSNLRPLYAKRGSYTLSKNRLSHNIRHGIYKGFRTGRGGRWEKRVGYTVAELRGHLQKQFTDGMSWANYGANDGQWQIDHIKPVSFFCFSSYDQEAFKNYWSLSNLRPLWARDNWARSKTSQPMRKCFDESPYASCLDCPRTVHIKYRGRFCQRFRRWVPQWWENGPKLSSGEHPG